MTPPAGVERLRWVVTRPEYPAALAACGIPRSPFFPLNRALPLKQCVSDKSDTKECRNCKATKSRYWFFDFVLQVVLKTIFLCETRWVYAVYHGGQDRPEYLWSQYSIDYTFKGVQKAIWEFEDREGIFIHKWDLLEVMQALGKFDDVTLTALPDDD
ncbi:hypothetical protein PENSUB_9381 [Penicillium subrubescens]|uniref:Uncharacterized protein n=1 Tax=Penicillium subrubescens TaxID=1316194 RepID=A0A1Q5TDI9_9EURO|nr:hypothetical protein PENSUB_9381 [Penicillium subrubescens]